LIEPVAALRYLAALAPAAAEATTKAVTRRSDLAPVGWLDPKGMLGLTEEGPPLLDRTGRLDRLVTLDRLHSNERLLRVGWLWLAGHDERASAAFMAPLISAPVMMERAGRGYRLVVMGDAELTPGLITDLAVRDVLEEALSTAFTIATPSPPQQPVLSRYTQFKAWLRQVTEEIGVLTPDVVDPEVDPWDLGKRTQLALGLAVCIFLGRDVDRPTVATDISNWAGRDVERTAFAAVYTADDDAQLGEASTDVGITSAYPLNEAQRAAILRSRAERITVISGPPGTGKSHLAAALAVDEVGLGHNVLLATQSDHAADVLADLLERHEGPRFVRFGNRDHRRRVADELAGGMAAPYSDSDTDRIEERLTAATDRVLAARSRIMRLLGGELDFTQGLADRERLAAAVAVAPRAVEPGFDPDRAQELLATAVSATGLFAEQRRDRAERKLRDAIGAGPDGSLDDIRDAIEAARAEARVRRGLTGGGLTLTPDWDELDAAETAWRSDAGRALEARRRSRENRRRVSTRAVAGLASALRSGRAKRRRLLRDLVADHFLDVLPLWLGTLREIDDTLPGEPAMFDVVILDEASQIDQLRAASALCRARRVVVVGDPHQLRHVSFVSDEASEAAAAAEGIAGETARQLDVRRNSLFDAAAAVSPVTELVEHFRSVPHIIGFSDSRFYGGRLRLMTQHPGTEAVDAIRVIQVDGARNAEGFMAEEVEVAAVEVRSALDSGATSIGVVCPFRAQADALEAMLLSRFREDELVAGGLRVGTVHAFQGNERDIVIATLGLGEEDLAGSLSFAQDPHLFNVMVTRARREMVVITAVDPTHLPGGLLADYLRWAADPPRPSAPARRPQGWVGDLATALDGFQLPVVAGYPVAGYAVDLAVGGGADAVGVECVVYERDPERHVERHQALTRAGWTMRDAFRSRWLASPDDAVTAIVTDLLRDQVEAAGPIRAAGQ
jgi:AAA domain